MVRGLPNKDAHPEALSRTGIRRFRVGQVQRIACGEKIFFVKPGGKRRIGLLHAENGRIKFLHQAAVVPLGGNEVKGLGRKTRYGPHSFNIIHAHVEHHIRRTVFQGFKLFLAAFAADVHRSNHIHFTIIFQLLFTLSALAGNGNAEGLGRLRIDGNILRGIVKHLQDRLHRAVAVARVVILLAKFLAVKHSAHQVDFSLFQHVHQGKEALVRIAGNLNKFVIPPRILGDLLQIFVSIAGVIPIFVKLGKPRLDRKSNPHGAGAFGHGVCGGRLHEKEEGGRKQQAQEQFQFCRRPYLCLHNLFPVGGRLR